MVRHRSEDHGWRASGPAAEVAGWHEVHQVGAKLIVAVVVEALDRDLLGVGFIRSTCPFDQG